MTARSRNYKTEYARRIARGLNKGLSRSEARGHARAAELSIRQPATRPTYSRQLEAGLREIKGGQSLTAAAREIRVSPERLRRYVVQSGIAQKQGQRWKLGTDTRRRVMLFYSEGEPIIATVGLPEAEEIGRYMAAVGEFLGSNDPTFLVPFDGKGILDAAGNYHPFETNPNELYRLVETGSSTFEDVYRVIM